jgi:hypothetical protein
VAAEGRKNELLSRTVYHTVGHVYFAFVASRPFTHETKKYKDFQLKVIKKQHDIHGEIPRHPQTIMKRPVLPVNGEAPKGMIENRLRF